MASLRHMFVFLVISVVASEAAFLGASLPLLLGGKLILPQILALKMGVGMLGLKFAGARYLKEKVLVPASLAGAVAGYKTTSVVMDAPFKAAEIKGLALKQLFSNIPTFPFHAAQPGSPSNFEATFKLPALPVPSFQWETKDVNVPKVVFSEPQKKTITITKHIVPARVSAEPPKEEVVDRPY